MKYYDNSEYESEEILGYDCDGYEINEFRVLRAPFSADIEDWDEEPNIDPRFYCLVRSSNGEVWALSVYDDWTSNYIKKYEKLSDSDEISVLIKPVSEMVYYEVAVDGISGNEWYYDRDREELRRILDSILNEQKESAKKLTIK